MEINVSAIIVHKGKVLIVRRDMKDKHFPGYWGIPGGGMEAKDSNVESVAIREVFEELGLHIVPNKVQFNNRQNDVVYLVLTASLKDEKEYEDKLKLSHELSDYQWAALADIEAKDFTPFTKDRLVKVLKTELLNR